MQQFDIAFGRCTVRDGELVIERSDPDEMSRWELFRTGLSLNAAHRPTALAVYLGVMLLSGLVFVFLLVDIYLSNPAVAPLVIGLGIFGVVVVLGGIELSVRRLMRKRHRLRSALDEEFDLVPARRIPLDDVTGVTVRSVSMTVPFVTGKQFLVHFQQDGVDATARLGFPGFMREEEATARAVFEQHDIPVEDR